MSARPRILVLNQYYWPGVEATAQLLAQLCEALARDYDVTVVTGHLHGHELPDEEERNGVRIVRVRSTTYERSQLHHRAANYGSYLGESIRTALRGERPDLVLCMTDPPVVGDIGLVVARRFDVPLLVISQDVFPEIAERVKRLEHPLVLGALRKLVGLYLRRADRVVAIGETMKLRLVHKGAREGRIEVIPNWVDTTEIQPHPRRNAWSAARGLDDELVVMHSGQHRARPGPRHARPRGDVPPRPRPAADHGDRLRGAARRAHAARAAPRSDADSALPRLPAARAAAALACHG